MRPLTDSIEAFIKSLLEEGQEQVDVQRNELAQYFRCAPSQITYVLSTRFTPDHGYVIESRRGGGGYIRIVRVVQQPGQQLLYLIHERIGESITEGEATRIITQLVEQKLLTPGEGEITRAAVSAQALAVPMPDSMKDAVRARMLKAMLTTVARRNTPGAKCLPAT